MSYKSTATAAAKTAFTELFSDIKSLGQHRFPAVAGAVMIGISVFFRFVNLSNDAYYYSMELTEYRWLVWGAATSILIAWVMLPTLEARRRTLAITVTMWLAVALLAYGVYFACTAYQELSGMLAESVAQAKALVGFWGEADIPKKDMPEIFVTSVQQLREFASGNTALIVPGFGSAIYIAGCLLILTTASRLRSQERKLALNAETAQP